jgi:hypothetical protein
MDIHAVARTVCRHMKDERECNTSEKTDEWIWGRRFPINEDTVMVVREWLQMRRNFAWELC